MPMNNFGDLSYMELARGVAGISTCNSRRVGAVLILRDGTGITGYNDMPKETNTTCIQERRCRCFGPNVISGKDLDKCFALHAEAKCISHAARLGHATEGARMFTTTLPCMECAKLIINAGIKEVIFDKPYPNDGVWWLFEQAGVNVRRLDE